MMNDATLKQIAAVKAIVSKGNHVWIWNPSGDPPRIGRPSKICAYQSMAFVQNCSLLQKDSTDEPNGLHARPYWIAPNASCPDMVGWPLVARGSRGSQPGKNLPHRYEKGCNVEKAISDACHAWRSRIR